MRLLLILALSIFGCAQVVPIHSARYSMGTILKVTAYSDDKLKVEKCLDIADRLDKTLSNYIESSEVEIFNGAEANAELKVSPDLYELIKVSQEITKKTNGAFDITVRPAIKLWQESGKNNSIPSEMLIEKNKKIIGSHLIKLKDGKVLKDKKQVSIDTGGVGKGFAVDKIAECLKENGINSALIDFGQSSMRALNPPPGEYGWEIILNLYENPKENSKNLFLANQALSVSRAKGKLTKIEKQYFGHIIDPRKATPVSHNRGAVAVLDSATEAEGLTKALIIYGEADSFKDNFNRFEYGIALENGRNYFSHSFFKSQHN